MPRRSSRGGRRRIPRGWRRRRLWVLAAMLAVAGALIWVAVSATRQPSASFRLAEPEAHAHDSASEITEQDRQQLQDVLESIDRAAKRK